VEAFELLLARNDVTVVKAGLYLALETRGGHAIITKLEVFVTDAGQEREIHVSTYAARASICFAFSFGT
jgi:hypothetical protein